MRLRLFITVNSIIIVVCYVITLISTNQHVPEHEHQQKSSYRKIAEWCQTNMHAVITLTIKYTLMQAKQATKQSYYMKK